MFRKLVLHFYKCSLKIFSSSSLQQEGWNWYILV